MLCNDNESKYVSTLQDREDLDVFSKGGTPVNKWFCCIFPQQSSIETEPWETRHVEVDFYLPTEEKSGATKAISSKSSEDDDTPQQESVVNGSPTSTLDWPPQNCFNTHEESNESSDVQMIHGDNIKHVNNEDRSSRDVAGSTMEVDQAESFEDFCERSLPWLASIDQGVCMPSPQKLETVSEAECASEEKSFEKEEHLSGLMMDCSDDPQEEVALVHSEDLEQNSELKAVLEPTKEQVPIEAQDVAHGESTEVTEVALDPSRQVQGEEAEETREDYAAPLNVSEPTCKLGTQETLASEYMQPEPHGVVEETTTLEQFEESKISSALTRAHDSVHEASNQRDVTSPTETECSPKELVPDMVQSYGSFDFSCSSSKDIIGLDATSRKLESIGEEAVLLKETPESLKAETTAETSSFNVLLAVSWVAVSLFALQGHELYEKYC